MIIIKNISVESFISFCDDVQIANEANIITTIKDKLIAIFTKLINFLRKKISGLPDGKFKLGLLKLLNRAKHCLNKSKALTDPALATELEAESKEIVELDKKLTTAYASKESRYFKVEKKIFARKMYKPKAGTEVYNFLESLTTLLITISHMY